MPAAPPWLETGGDGDGGSGYQAWQQDGGGLQPWRQEGISYGPGQWQGDGGQGQAPPVAPPPVLPPPGMMPPGMMPPPVPSAAGASGGDSGRWKPERRSAAERLVVQSADGSGGPAAFDTATGRLHGLAATVGPVAGIYGRFGETTGVLYRWGGRLQLWVDGRGIDLEDEAVRVYWGRSDATHAWFQVGVSGVCVFDARYPFPGAELDFGRVVEQIVVDPERRAGIFR